MKHTDPSEIKIKTNAFSLQGKVEQEKQVRPPPNKLTFSVDGKCCPERK
jgi:hypothetical protein